MSRSRSYFTDLVKRPASASSLLDAAIDSMRKRVCAAVPDPAAPEVPESSILDKISDVIPGETGQKVEDFVKGAAHKAEDVFENVKEKLGGIFGGDKK